MSPRNCNYLKIHVTRKLIYCGFIFISPFLLEMLIDTNTVCEAGNPSSSTLNTDESDQSSDLKLNSLTGDGG